MKIITPIIVLIHALLLSTIGNTIIAQEAEPTQKLKVLFLCTGNSCRSQMAEGWTRYLKSDSIEAYSAGIETHGLNPNAVRVMKESGVDISNHKSENISEYVNVPLDYVITVCSHADENCPVFPKSVKVIHHPFDDPPKLAQDFDTEEEKLNCYRRVRDEIKSFVETLPDSLTKTKTETASKVQSPAKRYLAAPPGKTNRKPFRLFCRFW